MQLTQHDFMAQQTSLQTLASMSPPPTIPTNPQQAKTLEANISALGNLNQQQILAFTIVCYYHYVFYNLTPNFNYINNHKQLRIDATSFMGGLPSTLSIGTPFPFSRMMAVMIWSASFGYDTTITNNVQSIVAESAGLRDTPEITLWQIFFYLKYLMASNGVP